MDNAQSNAQNLQTYLDDLIDQKNYQDLSPEVREELRNDLQVRLNDFIMARIIAAFSDEDVAAFEELIKQGKSQGELQNFAAEHIPDFVTFLTTTMSEFQSIYLAKDQPATS
jgi:hypothetical protein